MTTTATRPKIAEMAAQCCAMRFFAVWYRYLSSTHPFSVISEIENITITTPIDCQKVDSLGYTAAAHTQSADVTGYWAPIASNSVK